MRSAPAYSLKLILNIALSLTAVGIVVRATSAVKEIVFAGAFGASAETDSFVLAFTYANFLPSVIGGGLGTVLIAALADTSASLRGRGLFTVAKWVGSVSIACAIAVYALAPYALSLLFGLQGAELASATAYAHVMAPLGGTLLMCSAMNALLHAEKKFYLAGFTPLATPLAIMLVIFLAAGQIGVEAAAWGTAIGGLVEFSILSARVFLQRDVLFRAREGQRESHPGWFFWKSVGILSFADAVAAMTPMVDQVFLARLDTGAITHFNYAFKVNSVLIGLLGTAFTVTIYPYLSDLAAQRDSQALKRLIWRLAAVVLPITALATSLVYAYSYELVDLLFGRGNFTPTDTRQVGAIQRVFCFQLVFYIALLLAMPVLNALRATRSVFCLACINLASTAFFNWLFYEDLGAAGIALSSVLTSAVGVVCALLFIRAALARSDSRPSA